MLNKYNQYHIVTNSPWPLIASFNIISIAINLTTIINKKTFKRLAVSLVLITISTIIWWKNTIIEAIKEGIHQKRVINRLKIGIILFICSEVLFFGGFFWAYFHIRISPNTQIGQFWPPIAIKAIHPINVPLLNTILLISSGATITYSHHSILSNNRKQAIKILIYTCVLGTYFIILQILEYFQTEFCLSDSSFGSTFFILTGFHGLHVFVGTSYLITTLFNIKKHNITKNHHIIFEIASWYWHFVDVIWMLLYISIYWWNT